MHNWHMYSTLTARASYSGVVDDSASNQRIESGSKQERLGLELGLRMRLGSLLGLGLKYGLGSEPPRGSPLAGTHIYRPPGTPVARSLVVGAYHIRLLKKETGQGGLIHHNREGALGEMQGLESG